MFRRFGAWLKRTAEVAGIALLIMFLIVCLASISEAAHTPPRPTYMRDAKTNLCFATFEKKEGIKEHLLVPCSPEVLREVGR